MPQMDYIVRDVSKSAFFARSSAYEIIDKNGRLLYVNKTIIRDRNYLLSLDTEWFAHDSDVIYITSSGTSLNRIRVRSYMNEERLKQPKIKEMQRGLDNTQTRVGEHSTDEPLGLNPLSSNQTSSIILTKQRFKQEL